MNLPKDIQMNTKINPIRAAGYEPDARLAPANLPSPLPHLPNAENELETLKNRLLRAELKRATTLDINVHLRRAANDAAALAWLTPYPLLVLPVLFDEKARAARKMASRAARIRERSEELLSLTE